MLKFFGFLLKLVGFVTLCLVLAATALFPRAGHWLTADDDPGEADAIVVLGGSYMRALYAADLYRKHFAPVVLLSNVARSRQEMTLAELGVELPRQEAVNLRILQARGVPGGAIRLFGQANLSTAQEAEELKRYFGGRGARLLVVTSPSHVRRAKWIIESTIPNAFVRVVGNPYEPFPERWWTNQGAAGAVVGEYAKLVWYAVGGVFRSGT